MKRYVTFLGGLCILSQIMAQSSLDDLNVIVKNDFEHNTPGIYNSSEWLEDWFNPEWNCRLTDTEIVQNEDDQENSSQTLQWNYPAGSVSPDQGGGQWFVTFPKMDEIYVSYDMMFMPGFEYQLGGKLPSVQGGNIPATNKPNGYDGFTGGLMFKENGMIVFYFYYPDSKYDEYGQSIPWGGSYSTKTPFSPSSAVIEYSSGEISYSAPGEWHNITYRMVLNSIKTGGGGNYDGILEAYFDGKLVTQVSHILFRHTTDLGIDVMRMYTFFGGGSDEWRNPIDEWLKVDNVILYTYKDGIDVPRGNTLSPTNRTINYRRNFGGTVSPDPVVPTNNSPVISNQQFTVKESAFSTNLIGTVIAKDADAGQTLTYSIASGNESGTYSINSETGVLSSTGSNIFIPGTVTHQLGIKVTDNGTSPKSASATITVNLIGDAPVIAMNNPPAISNQQFYISEADFEDNKIGSVIATDKDPGQYLSFAIVSGNEAGIFAINSQTGVLTTTNGNIFGPMAVTFDLTIKVTDSSTEPESTSAKITIKLVGESGIVYIDPENINDALANGLISHPYASWKDIVWKEGYTYLQKRGTTITADKILIGANKVTLGAYGEGNLPIINSNTNTYLISGFEKASITIRELNLQAPNAVSSIYYLGNAGDSIIVEHCQLNANVNAIKVANGQKLIVRYSTISSNMEGVYSSAANNQVYYNIFKNCQEAINIMGNSAIAEIYNNVFYNNDESLSVTYADLTLYNNIFYLNSSGQSAINHGTGNIQSNNNIYYPEQAGFITIDSKVFNNLQQLQQTMKIDMNSFISDPQFMDIYDDNFMLTENSPAINAGINLNLGLDLLGSSVPLSGAADIGVHEFTGIISPQENQEQPSLILYPNPSTGNVNVMAEFDQPKEKGNNYTNKNEIRVVDLTGKTIFSKQIEQTSSTVQDNIDLSGISNGLYFVVLQYADKRIKEKLIISK